MDVSAPGYIAAEWDRLKGEKNMIPEEVLHRCIVDILVSSCFYCDENIQFAREKLMMAMPKFHALVRKANLKRQIKLVKETALKVSCPLGNR